MAKYTGENQSKQARYAERKSLERNTIIIPPPADLQRRRAMLADPVAFLNYYFPDRFWSPFAAYQKEMIQLIVDVAEFGGDQAIVGVKCCRQHLIPYVFFPVMLRSRRKCSFGGPRPPFEKHIITGI